MLGVPSASVLFKRYVINVSGFLFWFMFWVVNGSDQSVLGNALILALSLLIFFFLGKLS